ncbi:MAG TPA: hypothetical protein VL137_05250, partial [Polyangiaceae bacterium]|nr:hypothetical protein [Polyangiaceae bacterium]
MPRAPRAWRWAPLGLLLAGSALADPFPSVDLTAYRQPLGYRAGLRGETPQPEGNAQVHLSLAAAYANNPLPGSAPTSGTGLSHQLLLDALIARGFGSRLTLAVDLPFAPYQSGPAGLPHTALGDLEVRAKETVLGAQHAGGFQLALGALATAPTGNARSYLGEHAFTAGVLSSAELDLLVVRVRGNLGAQFRSEPRHLQGEKLEHSAPWVLGLVFRPQVLGIDPSGRISIFAEAFGAAALGRHPFAARTAPVGLSFSTRMALGDFSPLVGVEVPLNDALGNADLRVIGSLTWAPREYDSDHDGIPDEIDECPEIPEDKDGFEDQDGCNDSDNDDDGVSDAKDQCPYEQEDEDGYMDTDGCADPDN